MKATFPTCLSVVLLLGSALLARAALPGNPAERGVPGTNTGPAAVGNGALTIRIKTGIDKPLTDETGVVWQADTGFVGGDTIDRPGIAIEKTKTPSLYRAERYDMSAFHWKVPNGKYTVKLYFAETYEDITAPGQRVFSYNVEGKEFKDFDVFKKSGGAQTAYVETVEVEVKDGSLDITFTPQVENPQINALEIIPAAPANQKAEPKK